MRQSFKFPAAFDSHDQRGLKYRFIAITQITATRRTYPSCSTSTAFESCLHVAKTNHCEDKCVPVCFRQHLQALEIHANHANFVRKNRFEESPSHEVSKNRRKTHLNRHELDARASETRNGLSRRIATKRD